MELWIKLLKSLINKGYSLSNNTKYLKHIEYPEVSINGVIDSNVTPLITTYELIDIIEMLSNNTINKGKCVINTSDTSHIEWIEYIGTDKIPTNIDIEVNIAPDYKGLSIHIYKGILECELNISSDNTYEGILKCNKAIESNITKALIIWECEYDHILNKGLSKILLQYFNAIEVLGICPDNYEVSDISNWSVVIKLTMMNYMSKTLLVKRCSIQESIFSEILMQDLDKYLSNTYYETPQV